MNKFQCLQVFFETKIIKIIGLQKKCSSSKKSNLKARISNLHKHYFKLIYRTLIFSQLSITIYQIICSQNACHKFYTQIINLRTVVFKQTEVSYLTLKTLRDNYTLLVPVLISLPKAFPHFLSFFFMLKVKPYLTLIISATKRGNNSSFLISPK